MPLSRLLTVGDLTQALRGEIVDRVPLERYDFARRWQGVKTGRETKITVVLQKHPVQGRSLAGCWYARVS